MDYGYQTTNNSKSLGGGAIAPLGQGAITSEIDRIFSAIDALSVALQEHEGRVQKILRSSDCYKPDVYPKETPSSELHAMLQTIEQRITASGDHMRFITSNVTL